MKTVIGVFERAQDAEHAVDDLVSRGFDRGDVTLVAEQGRVRAREAAYDAADVAAETPLVAPAPPPHPQVPPAFGGSNIPMPDWGKDAEDPHMILHSLGLADSESQFYLGALPTEGRMVVLQTSDERAEAAKAIMNRHHALDLDRSREAS